MGIIIWILILKGKYFTFKVRHTKNKSGYKLPRQWSIILFNLNIDFNETAS